MFMRIGSSIVNLSRAQVIECYKGVECLEISVEYDDGLKRFAIPTDLDPERVAAIIHLKLAEGVSFCLAGALHEAESNYRIH